MNAGAVQRYVEAHYKLAADMVGAIPLGDTPPKSTGKQQWDGVCSGFASVNARFQIRELLKPHSRPLSPEVSR